MVKILSFVYFILFFTGLTGNYLTTAAPSARGNNGRCGQHIAGAEREAKIVGGYDATQGEFPWMVSFKSKIGHFCGGSVISESHLITAAHCFYKNEYLDYTDDGLIDLKSVNVTLGEYSLKNSSEHTEVQMSLKRIHLHPNYDAIAKQNDIAIIELTHKIAVVPSVSPVCLPNNEDSKLWAVNNKATVIGWGLLHFKQDYYDWKKEMDVLKKVDVKIWNTTACINKYKGFPQFPSKSFLCAGEKGKESCTGDSGGPLLRLNGNNNWVVIGVVANGKYCGDKGQPGIYTLVSDFLPWIESYTNKIS